jgi:hypothetical protein
MSFCTLLQSLDSPAQICAVKHFPTARTGPDEGQNAGRRPSSESAGSDADELRSSLDV